MSRDFRHGMKQSKIGQHNYKKQEDYVEREVNTPRKRRAEDRIRHAVRHQDIEVFENYDEYNL